MAGIREKSVLAKSQKSPQEPVTAVGGRFAEFLRGFPGCLVRLVVHGEAGVELVAGLPAHDDCVVGALDAVKKRNDLLGESLDIAKQIVGEVVPRTNQ